MRTSTGSVRLEMQAAAGTLREVTASKNNGPFPALFTPFPQISLKKLSNPLILYAMVVPYVSVVADGGSVGHFINANY